MDLATIEDRLGELRRCRRPADRRSDPHRLTGREYPRLIQQLAQRPARHQLHHDERLRAGFRVEMRPERLSYPQEVQTRRAYLLARRWP